VDKTRAQKLVTLLLRDKVLVKLSDELVFHRSALDALRRLMTSQKSKSSQMDVAKFKELTESAVSMPFPAGIFGPGARDTSRGRCAGNPLADLVVE